MHHLDGKVVLVTGGARGIGAAIAQAVVAEGANVVIGDVLDRDGEELVSAIGRAATYVHLDVTRLDDWAAAVATAVETWGALDVLVNNAGIARYGAIDQCSFVDWENVLAVNLTGAFNGIRAAVPALKAAGGGSIVNISSMAGMRGEANMPGYVASKWGVRGLTKAAALDLAPYGIRVNSIHPGIVHTPLNEDGPQVELRHVAMGRIGQPMEIARLAVFLASEASSFSTGAEFIADGGELAGMIRQPGAPEGRLAARN
ncbi:glucose 1-dehydrogenase [Lysobacter sp. KIS68-7]|uniref:glucose 1-dehydrogenase n=1 Tax=Lysobacter sp. KIS68-7 TaxID=2904252 RepID=UPI001E324840|nr:glucose 1-dehydrogenase [Lysobacter sp. KIS68-7]UHQ19393.1 glucose 1-dehydrogenase [Lysobacter sp. KIS68-7]